MPISKETKFDLTIKKFNITLLKKLEKIEIF